VHFVEEAFWIVLGREINPVELRETLRGYQPADAGPFIHRLLSSPEFRLVYTAWKEDRATGRDLAAEERGLRALGSDDGFVRRAYQLLFDRSVDDEGYRHFTGALATGESRINVLRSLVMSEEFERRYLALSPQGGLVPRDTQLCELANPAKWSNPEWMALLRDLQVLPDHPLSMHRKSYELTQLLYGLRRLNQLREDTCVLSVGAGHECVLYWLANHVGRVVATDLYEGIWQSVQSKEGDQHVLSHPEDFAPFPYRRDRLSFLRMDARHLDFPDGTFDVAYSLSSIEHFDKVSGGIQAVDEMARVLKPGGVLALATEYVLAGPPHPDTFQPDEIRALLSRPGLTLVHTIDEAVYQRYEYAAVDLYQNPHQTPHMVVRMNETVFTTVFAFLRRQ
jgi:SAM-dependent methyltransferase